MTVDVSCGMFSNVIISQNIRIVLRDSDMDSEDVRLIRRSVSDSQKHAGQRVLTNRYIIKTMLAHMFCD